MGRSPRFAVIRVSLAYRHTVTLGEGCDSGPLRPGRNPWDQKSRFSLTLARLPIRSRR